MKHIICFLIISVYTLIFVSGCSYKKNTLAENTINIPVFLNSELTMAVYMEDAGVVDNLADELSISWDFKTSVEQTIDKKIREVNNCNSALAAYDDGFETTIPSYHTVHQSMVIQCRAITIAVKMTPSNISYLNASLDKAAISELPTAIAFIGSTSERASILANASLKTLNEVTPITGFTQVNDYKFQVEALGGSQTMVVLAKGDTDGDQIEDLLMQVTNATEGGSYRATHLFVLSKKEKEGSWLLLSEY